MAKLTGTDAALPARCAAPGWMRWAHFTRDGLAHAFPVEDSQQGRWLRAVCSATVPPTTVEPEEHEVQAPGTAEPGAAVSGGLIPPPPVHHHPRAAR